MSDESKTSNLASVVSLNDLGASLRQDFQSLLAAASSGWFDGPPLSRADSQDLYALELETHDLWRVGGDLLVLEAWLTSGFLPTTQAEPFAREENVILTDDNKAPFSWPPPSAQPTTSRPLQTYLETTFAEDESLAERGPTALPGWHHPTPARPLATVREDSVAKHVNNPEATTPFTLLSGSALENTASDQAEAAINRQQTPRPYTSPVIRRLKDLASRLLTSSVDEHALSAESTAERSDIAEPELLATTVKDTDNTAHAAAALPQAGDQARTASPAAVARRTNNFFFTATDDVSTTPDDDFTNGPAEPIVLGTTRAVESLARLGISTLPEPGPARSGSQNLSENFSEPSFSSLAKEDRRDSTPLSTGSARRNVPLRQRQNYPAASFVKEGDAVALTAEEERRRQAPPMAPRSSAAVTQASATVLAPTDAGDARSSVTVQQALAAPDPLEPSGSFGSPGKFSPLERLSIEDVDTILDSLEREIEHEYRRYYRD